MRVERLATVNPNVRQTTAHAAKECLKDEDRDPAQSRRSFPLREGYNCEGDEIRFLGRTDALRWLLERDTAISVRDHV